MAKHMRPPRRRTGRILRGIVTHAGGRVGPRRRSNPLGGRIISTRELTYVRRRLTVLIAMFSVVTMVVLLSVRGCSNDGDGSSGSVSSAGAARSGATVDPTDGSVADDGSSDESFSDKSGSGRVRSQSASRSMFKAAVPAPAQPERDLTAQASAALAGVFSGARYSVSVVDLSNAGTLVDIDSSQVFASASTYKLFVTKLYRGEIWNDDDRDMVIGLMKRQQYRSGIPAGIGGNGTVADKVGFRDSYLHDAGIVYSGKGDYAFVIMTSGSSWTAIANASAALYQLL